MKIVRLDNQLIDEILAGSRASFGILYKKYQQPLFAVCLRYAANRDDAQDMFQEGLIRIFKNLKKYDSNKGEFLPWAKRVMVNVCLNKLRSQKLIPPTLGLEIVQLRQFDESVIDKLSFEEMVQLIQQIPDGYRTVFNLYVMDGYSHVEIAEKLNISTGTSKSQLSKARKYIAKKMDGFFSEIRSAELYG